ncbi:type II toxin-antitoxin system PemK/MazF family toxin [Nonomuraea sp. WAC 01424]|uniref:type II toxin-antitoxin system PemK/MazF family toxin n=1 Tax=Nonomuraea sp. WAC 01424 TaxID=2203200 RepID=UPI00163BE3B6
MNPGDIRLVWFPFSHSEPKPYKKRPVLIVGTAGRGADRAILAAMITSSAKRLAGLGPHDVAIKDWQSLGLVAPSVVRAHRIWTADDRDFENRLFGQVKDTLLEEVRQHVRGLLT